MGKRGSNSGMGGGASSANFQLPEPKVKPGKPTKLSEEVFRSTYAKLRNLAADEIKAGRFNTSGYSGFDDDQHLFSRQMLAGMQSSINTEWRRVEVNEKRGWDTPEHVRVQKYALTMLNKMVNKYFHVTYEEEV